MPGRPPKPTNLLQLTGAFAKNPQRLRDRAGEPVPAGKLGAPPRFWRPKRGQIGPEVAPELCKIWREVAKMAPWLTSGDRIAVELLCRLLLKVRQGIIGTGEINALKGLCNSCGLDPSGRAKIDTSAIGSKAATADPRDAFAAKRG